MARSGTTAAAVWTPSVGRAVSRPAQASSSLWFDATLTPARRLATITQGFVQRIAQLCEGRAGRSRLELHHVPHRRRRYRQRIEHGFAAAPQPIALDSRSNFFCDDDANTRASAQRCAMLRRRAATCGPPRWGEREDDKRWCPRDCPAAHDGCKFAPAAQARVAPHGSNISLASAACDPCAGGSPARAGRLCWTSVL